MRVMFSCTAGQGHFRPLVPLARAFENAGHEVVFVTAASFAGNVVAAGFSVLPAGIGGRELEDRYAPFRARVIQMPPGERRKFAYKWRFGSIEAPAKLTGLRAAVDTWVPDLLVHESADLAAPLVAASQGIPTVHHAFGRLVPTICFEHAAEEMSSFWQEAGLTPDALCGVFRGSYLDICPPSLQSETLPAGVRSELMRPTYPADPEDALPSWVEELPDRSTVYVTLGTMFNDLSTFRIVLSALSDLDCNVIATVGRDNDPGALAPIPPNAKVERYVAQSLLLPHCALTVAHGGSGSMLGALSEGLPMVLLPQGADQFENAGRLQELGVGRMVMPADLTEAAVRDAAALLLRDESYGRRARTLAEEIAAMSTPAQVVDSLVRAHGPG